MFTEVARSASQHLSSQELDQFEENGWLGPYPLLTEAGVERLHQSYIETGNRFSWTNLKDSSSDNNFDDRPWFKSLHAFVFPFCAVASHPAIVERLSPILGPNIIAWGVSVTTRRPGQIHRWHVDIEHIRWHGVSVFIGLKNVSVGSSLKIISGSHRLQFTPQSLGLLDDLELLAVSQAHRPECELRRIDMREGEFFIFHGRLWHGSNNATQSIRTSIIAQYSTPDAAIAIPTNWDEPVNWHPYRPPCVLVRGTDPFHINRIDSPPEDTFRDSA